MTHRDLVYAAIDGERAYQEAGRGNAARDPSSRPLSPGDYILLMERYLSEAREEWIHPGGNEACLHDIRKVTALGVQMMEVYGAPFRE